MKLQITGMTCGHCAARVEKTLINLGATNIKIDIKGGSAECDCSIGSALVAEKIEALGFDVVVK